MTFEGDAAGKWLIELMKQSPAKEKRLLVDSYSKVVINDHFVKSLKYLKDETFRNEVTETRLLIKEAQDAGIKVQFTNPVGLIGQRYPLRNHKKMVLIDEEISFLGGINFSDHNFAWHDMMVKLTDRELGKILTGDFMNTWNGVNQSETWQTSRGQLYLFNGSNSTVLYETFFEHLRKANDSIKVISPYISEPLLKVLRSVAKHGVEITVISPQENNKSIFKNIILSEREKGYFKLMEYPGMSHMKAILIDGKKLIFGSSNYDLVSYFFEQEVVFLSEDQSLVHEFEKKVLSEVTEFSSPGYSKFQANKAALLMKLLNGVGGLFSRTILRPH